MTKNTSYGQDHQEWLERTKADYISGSGKIREMHFAGGGGGKVVKAFTAHTDNTIRLAFEKACSDEEVRPESSGCSLLSIGGYGRGELNPFSDIDLMFLCRDGAGPAERDFPTRVLHILWDLGFNIGYSVRSAEDCCSLIRKDFTILTSLLESRRLCGEKDLYRVYEEKLARSIKPKDAEEFIREKLLERTRRHKKYGDSVYLREPNIKEGAGGLRDIHAALWIARIKYGIKSLEGLVTAGILKEPALRRLRGSKDWLLRLRNELHYVSSHKQDVLTYELQESAAGDFGYIPRPNRMAVENFMRAYFIRARDVREITGGIIERALDKRPGARRFFLPLSKKKLEDGYYLVGRELCHLNSGPDAFSGSTATLLKAFSLSQSHSARMSDTLRETVSDSIRSIAAGRMMVDAGPVFMEVIGKAENIYETLEQMHRMKLLGRVLPEFGRTTALVQHDLYHMYTVDEHSLIAVRKIQELFLAPAMASSEYKDALLRVKDRQVLFLATLMHDCGKALGKDHSEQGARLALDAARRLGMDEKRAARVESLVRNHLLMAKISQRRELSDPKVIERFCRIVDDTEFLDMLYVLTYADMSAVGPEVLNEWRMMLLKELHVRAFGFLSDPVSSLANEKVRLARLKEALAAEASSIGVASKSEFMDYLDGMPPSYPFLVPSVNVIKQFRLARGLKSGEVVIDHEHNPRGYTDLTIVLHDFFGVLYLSAGALAAKNMNILSAQIFTGRDGIIVDMLQVTDYNKKTALDEGVWRDIIAGMTKLLRGQTRVRDIMPKRSAYSKRTALTERPVKVIFDNESSDRYTILEVYAPDRIGLLYDITRELFRLGVYLTSAKVDTDVDRVVDVFYVTDIFKQKITDKDRLQVIQDSLIKAVSGKN